MTSEHVNVQSSAAGCFHAKAYRLGRFSRAHDRRVIAMDAILVVDANASGLKFDIFSVEGEGRLRRRIKGRVDGLGSCPRLQASNTNAAPLANRVYPVEDVPDIATAVAVVSTWLQEELHVRLFATGHRIIQGGPDYNRPTLIDEGVMARLERLVALAPLHQPHNLSPIRWLLSNLPALPQVACFDTAFHRSREAASDRYAIPHQLHAEGVRRYGFHGLSFEYIARILSQIAPEVASGRVIVARLGSRSSMCALRDGRSVESTGGFTNFGGLPSERSAGEIDPGVALYLMSERGMSPSDVRSFLDRDCGLRALSGLSGDMRELEASSDPRAELAIEHFVYRVSLSVGGLAAALQGLDALVLTGGIGENSATIRARIADRVRWLGVTLDAAANNRHARLISRPDSHIPVYVLPTDEQLMIAQHTLTLVLSARSPV